MSVMVMDQPAILPKSQAKPAALSVKDLQVSYSGQPVLQNVNFAVDGPSFVGIIGPNGAGKSTLLKAVLGLVPRDRGQIAILGQPLSAVRKNLAYIPQRSEIDWDFPIGVFETVLMGTYPKLGWLRWPGQQQKQLALACLERVGMADYAQRQIGQLSSGQQQRVFLARALAQQADILFLDEPLAGVDAASEAAIIAILQDLQRQGKTIFMVHHDLSKVRQYFDRLLLLAGRLVAFGPTEQVFRPDVMAATFDYQFTLFKEMEA